MRITRIGSMYLILIWGIVFVLLGSVLYIGYRQSVTDLEALMQSEAIRLIDVVTVAAHAGIHSLDEVERLTEQRLFDNARIIDELRERIPVSDDQLSDIAHKNNLHMINILDRNGESIARSRTPGEGQSSDLRDHNEAVERVLSGKSDEEVIGFMEGGYYRDKRYGVVIRSKDGGAVVVNADSERMLAFRRSVGLGTLFRDLSEREGVEYLALQDTLGIRAASPGVTQMTRIQNEPFLRDAYIGLWGTRFFEYQDRSVIEVVRKLVVDEVDLGLLRIGLSSENIDDIKERTRKQFILLFVVALLSGAILIVLIMLKQNFQLLATEHDRILQEVRSMEEEARRTERLTSMGRLAAGVAHEIRNPLNAVSIIAQRLKAEFTPGENREEYGSLITTIRSEVSRISGIIEDFLKYARPPKLETDEYPIEPLVNSAVMVVGERARINDIVVTVDSPEGAVCMCDANQIKQALINLLLNAIDAVGTGGTIDIRVRKSKGSVTLSITDSGSGIPENVLPNIFDPYFTTRENGTGLGLAEVHRIITAHGGRIQAGNSDGGGAVFTIQLPDERTHT